MRFQSRLRCLGASGQSRGWRNIGCQVNQGNYEYLQGYETVCLFFDDDAPGRQAAKDAASCLPPGKVTIAKASGYKDASDALQADDAQAIRKAIWDASEYRPDGIVSGKDLLEVVTQPRPKAKW